ncbi:MAG TPA: ATPase, T2SS/T4P/T4SS family, partial [Pirellulales bacterium]|nr:ATPase, T2SS/T4P/T4SS family [Pirellulales bacterium]
MQRLVADVHTELIQSLEITAQGPVNANQLGSELRPLAAELCRRRAAYLDRQQLEQLTAAVMSEIVGLGPLDPLMEDPLVSDILVNRFDEVFVERSGRLEPTGIRFADDQHLLRIIQRIVSRVGRRIDEGSPMVDARLSDGSRVNAII